LLELKHGENREFNCHMTALIIHGHFYQPPRENPWTGTIDRQPSAFPYHDWNERIHDECYGPNAFAHIVGANNTIERTGNNYANISFNFGPTLLSWLEPHHPKSYQRILDADRESIELRGGHGNAIAQAYGHAILPLCNERDRLTQVVWGLADFRYRFGREPEAMWLPETACNDETLELLIEQNLRYVILAPGQAARVREREGKWHSVKDGTVDPSKAYRWLHRDGSGRSIAIFFYDGLMARAIAFERALTSSRFLIEMFKRATVRGPMVNVATDGETYGHHFKFGDLALAHALEIEAREQGFWVTNYGEFLDRYPAEFEVEISNGPEGEGTSWSCAHGVDRWIRDCGCHTGGEAGWNQKWRGPLRAALDFLRDVAASQFEYVGEELFADPWATRNAYIEVILNQGRSRTDFLAREAKQLLSPPDQARALTLLEIQRNALLMYTSCGWFFSELSGIETLQIMKYAARVIELMDELGLPSMRAEFLDLMSEAESNIREIGNGADIYLRYAEPATEIVPATQ
jgi:alpha-amylase/alpha-mannosidase (GH57 family)